MAGAYCCQDRRDITIKSEKILNLFILIFVNDGIAFVAKKTHNTD